MPDEDQERFEDYLELERYIEELQMGQAAHPPANLTPERARIYQMAALFRSALPDAAEPRPEFVAALHARLLEDNAQSGQDIVPASSSLPQPEQPSTIQKGQETQPPIVQQQPRRARFFSRRSLLGGGAIAAASLVVGANIGAAFEKNSPEKIGVGQVTSTPYPTSGIPLVPSSASVPHRVATLAELEQGAVVRFTVDTLVGYVIRSDGDSGEPPAGEIIAMSAACTHMGCIVQWQDADRSFHCPCHGGIFTEYGEPDKASPINYLASLPRLRTFIKDADVYVMVPKGTSL